MNKLKEEKRYIIHLSPKDYVALTGIHLANVRDELADCGDETNKEELNKAIRIIDNNLVVKEVSEEEQVIRLLSELPFPCYFGKDRDGVLEVHIPVKESEVSNA
jgi:hypothetical protein